ncbi:hypothetical protein JW872_00735 [Candidatus Babeliales bacterium]|nr:hypothetical protein [Candidatus Babeliales bacterium]
MVSLGLDAIKSYLKKHTLSGYWLLAAGAYSAMLTILITALPLYIIAATCDAVCFWLSCSILLLYTIISYLVSKYDSIKIYLHNFILLSIPIGTRIVLYASLLYVGLGVAIRLVLGTKFTGLLYQDQLENSPQVPFLEPLVLKIGNILLQLIESPITDDIDEALSQKTVEQFLCYIHQGVTIILVTLSLVPAVWFYMWIRTELLHVHTEPKRKSQ